MRISSQFHNVNFKGIYDPTLMVTGGSGYIGSHLLDKLSKESDYNFVIVCRDKEKQEYLDKMIKSNIRRKSNKNLYYFYKTDLTEPKEVEGLFTKAPSFDAVLHLGGATYNAESLKDPRKYYENNLIASRNILNAMLDSSKPVKKLLFFSTSSTYMPKGSKPIRETALQNPQTPYAKTKYMIEQMVDDYKVYGLEPVTTRVFNVAGAKGENDLTIGRNIITVLLNAIKINGIFTLMGNNYATQDGTCERDFVHIDDVCDASSRLLAKMLEKPIKGVYNLGSGARTSLGEIVRQAQDITGKTIQLQIKPKLETEVPCIVANIDRIKELLQWAPEKDIKDIISSLWQYISANN